LQRLSVFAGGCTLEAAEAVCAGEEIQAEQVLNLLGSLVARSMAQAERPPGREPRYHLLETVRQYAREKLNEGGEVELLRTRHRDYYVSLSDRLIRARGTATHYETAGKNTGETDNYRLALERSFGDEANVEALPKLAISGLDRWPSYAELLTWVDRTIEWCRSHSDVRPVLLARFLGSIALQMGIDDLQKMLAYVEEAVDILRPLASEEKVAALEALGFLTWAEEDMGKLERALAHVAEAEAINLAIGRDPRAPQDYAWRTAWLMFLRADTINKQGRVQEAEQLIADAMRFYREAGHPTPPDYVFTLLAEVQQSLGKYDLAHDTLQLVLELNQNIGASSSKRMNTDSHTLYQLAALDIKQDNLGRAMEYLSASVTNAQAIPDHNLMAYNVGLAAVVAAHRGQAPRAAQLSGACRAMLARRRREPMSEYSLDTLIPAWRQRLDAPAISAAFEAGLVMSAEQAVAYALGDRAD
jgi:tetratricopeptide (TPR) repeat protein